MTIKDAPGTINSYHGQYCDHDKGKVLKFEIEITKKSGLLHRWQQKLKIAYPIIKQRAPFVKFVRNYAIQSFRYRLVRFIFSKDKSRISDQ